MYNNVKDMYLQTKSDWREYVILDIRCYFFREQDQYRQGAVCVYIFPLFANRPRLNEDGTFFTYSTNVWLCIQHAPFVPDCHLLSTVCCILWIVFLFTLLFTINGN